MIRSAPRRDSYHRASGYAYSPAELGMNVTAGNVHPLLVILSGDGSLFGEDLSWQDDAPCGQADPERWFPDKGGSVREAKAICRSCPSRLDCLGYALDHHEEFGLWGGLSPEEREDAARSRREGASLEAVAAAADAAWSAARAADAERNREMSRINIENMLAARADRGGALSSPGSPAPQSQEEIAA